MPADDYTREHKALYARIRGEASRLPYPEPEPRWLQQGPTAAWLDHLEHLASTSAVKRLADATDRGDDVERGAA